MSYLNDPGHAHDAFQILAAALRAQGIRASILYKLEQAISLCKEAIRTGDETPMEALELAGEARFEVERSRGTPLN